MLLTNLIAHDVPIVTSGDTYEYAKSLFHNTSIQQVPMVDNGQYIALISRKDLHQVDNPAELLKASFFENFKPAVSAHAHPFEALRMLHMHDLSVIPVIFEHYEYAGCITKDTLLKYLVENISIDVPGGIIVLEMEPRNYSLSEIARICENEQVLVVSSQLKTNVETAKLEITLKTNRTDLSALTQSFERHAYTVLETYGDQQMENDIIDRYKLLMTYINM
jgi:acetoin utilization protein AcuB